MQFQCGRNIIYHIDADELFVSHYDKFIVCNAKSGAHSNYPLPMPTRFTTSLCYSAPLLPRGMLDFAASFASLSLSSVLNCL